jgi:CRP/FNR family transcriptional regulator, cyclic AMP receptor protein
MTIRSIEQLVSEVPAFEGMRPQDLELIAGCGSTARFDSGEHIFRDGDAADVFYVVREGTVAIELFVPPRQSVTIETLHRGDLLGWSWLFPPYKWAFDARAVGSVAAITFDAVCLRGKCESNHELGYDLMRRFADVMVRRLQATRMRLLDVYGDHG